MRKEVVGNATLYLGDALSILPQLPEFGSIDLTFADMPYGVGMDYGDYDDTQETLITLIKDFVPLMRASAKRTAITCGVLNQWHYPTPNWVLGWFIGHGGSSGMWGFNMWQPILVYGKDPYLSAGLGRRPDTIYATTSGKTLEKVDHPCPKPEMVMERIISRCSIKGIVCDPMMGSGTTALACYTLNRQFIGIERNEKFFNIAVQRLKDKERQKRLHLI